MSRYFKRNIRVIVDDGSTEGLKIDTLKIVINLRHRVSSKSTEGEISIYNLTKDTEAKVRNKYTRTRVYVGYDGNYYTANNGNIVITGSDAEYAAGLQLIHDGQIRRIRRMIDGNNRITNIIVGGYIAEQRAAIVSLGYGAPVSPRRVILDAASTWGSTITLINPGIISDLNTLQNFSFSGETRKLYDDVLNPLGIQYTERNGQIEFSLDSEPIQDTIFVISRDSGMIAAPEVTEKGIRVKSLLNPRLVPGTRIQVISEVLPDTDGMFKIVESTHSGDNWDGGFMTMVEAVPIGDTRDQFPLLSGV